MMRVTDLLLQQGRVLEWATSLVMLMFAITLAFPGDTLLATPAFAVIVKAGLDEVLVSVLFALVAIARMTALYINGSWRRSPRLRMLGALFGAPIFAALGLAAAMPWFFAQQPALSTGAGTYLVLAFFDVIAAYRSAADASVYGRN